MEGLSNGWQEATWFDVMVDFRCCDSRGLVCFLWAFFFVCVFFWSLSKEKVANPPPFWIVPSKQGNLKLQLVDS